MTRTLMVLEDDATLRKTWRDVLTTHGDTVLEAATSEEALLQLVEPVGRPDVILVDYKLPGMNGIEFIRLLRQFDTRVGILLVSGVLDSAKAEDACEGLGVYAILPKPCKVKVLLEKIAGACELAQMSTQMVRAITEDVSKAVAELNDASQYLDRCTAIRGMKR